MQKKKLPILSTVLYVIAGLLVAYAIWSVTYSVNYISTMMAQGQLVFSGNEFEIVSFYMTNTAQYVLFAIVLFVLARITQLFSYEEDEEEELEDIEVSLDESPDEDKAKDLVA